MPGLRTAAVGPAGPRDPRADSGDRAQRLHRAGRAGGGRTVSLHPLPGPTPRRPAVRRVRHRVHLRDDRTRAAVHSGIRAEHGNRGAHHPPARRAAGRVRIVSFPHAQQGSDAAYRDALGCPVRFGQTWCGFTLSSQLAARRIENADPETRRIATKYLEATFLPASAPLSERVAELARRLLPTGQCSVDAIAEELALHPRTLQRRLVDEGVRCQDIIDRERRTQAARYLAEPGLHLSQIAGLLGYSEQSALNRSCQRWFGKTPRHYRTSRSAT